MKKKKILILRNDRRIRLSSRPRARSFVTGDNRISDRF